MAENKKKTARRWQILLAVVVAIGLVAAIAMVLNNLLGNKSDKPKKPPQISLIPTTPPPPPPPPKEEKRPPPKEQKEVKVEQQTEQKQAPPDPQLKMEGAAGDGPSAFASGKVTSEDLSKLGGGGGKEGAFSPFNNYAGLMKAEVQRQLARRSELRRRSYRVEIRVWVSGDGTVKQSELVGSSGDPDTDDSIRQALTTLPAFSEAPPANMPQPIRLRIVASGRP